MSDLHDKEAFFKKAREMAEGLSKEQLIGYYMAELETCCEVEEKLIMAEKALDKIADLEAKLAEKEKQQNQKSIEQLEKVKEFCNQREKDFTYLRDEIKAISHNKWVDYIEELRFIKAHIDNQIKLLKGEK